jgi:hypothetical protein
LIRITPSLSKLGSKIGLERSGDIANQGNRRSDGLRILQAHASLEDIGISDRVCHSEASGDCSWSAAAGKEVTLVHLNNFRCFESPDDHSLVLLGGIGLAEDHAGLYFGYDGLTEDVVGLLYTFLSVPVRYVVDLGRKVALTSRAQSLKTMLV